MAFGPPKVEVYPRDEGGSACSVAQLVVDFVLGLKLEVVEAWKEPASVERGRGGEVRRS